MTKRLGFTIYGQDINDPSIGRFLNEDTYEGQIDNPLSLNLYTYVENNPLRYIDPSGHMTDDNAGLPSTAGASRGGVYYGEPSLPVRITRPAPQAEPAKP
ncbi:hypothetical protein A8L34_01320 [Bacillus sp. FJAT-27264]|uniref:RHS repeat-associated core domain-containing protein n=1 Tax=Paenibacillus sp. (strain DSM 101736 / FJAT-27264) TaxID=1850362 RepID=UPI00080804B6|nr:RHS repeat-associated core domain-containing protein [Bacillus sp. FJAT-27264]OBZ18256.1 hypothetical protein A8L34_01320 [Bacillus sp. FJAT-27264]